MIGRPAEVGSLVANWGWRRVCRADAESFNRSLDNPTEAQDRVLMEILRENRSTMFGRKARFDLIRSSREFRERVPLSDYDDYDDYIARIREGESGVLTASAVERLVPSSGSTAARKLIPFTRPLRRAFHRAIAPWIHDMYRRDPDLMAGPAYWGISPALPESDEDSVVPIGFDDDSEVLGSWSRQLVRHSLAVPASVRHVEDVYRFRLATLLFLLRAPALRLISVWHPSFLDLLCAFMVENWSGLLQLVADGASFPELDHRDAGLLGRGEPALARTLERADPSRPETIWPRLGSISCWTDGRSAGAAAALSRRFPGTRIDPKGLVATEAFVSLPYGSNRPLAINSHYLEFLNEAGDVSGVADLIEGETYSVVVTTSGGLYRYRLHDLVRVEGLVGRTPSIVFVAKDDRVSDHLGEKLSEGFVAATLEHVLDERTPDFVMLAPEEMDGAIRYVLFIDRHVSLPDSVSELVDDALRKNPHYDWARKLGQLGAVEICPVGDGAHHAVVEELARRGQRLGGVKPSCLRPETGWKSVLSNPPTPECHGDEIR